MHVDNFMCLYGSIFIPTALSYITRAEFILNPISDGFEKCRNRGRVKTSINISINKPKQNRPTGRPKLKQEDNIKMILKEIVCNTNWIQLASDNVTGKLNITFSY